MRRYERVNRFDCNSLDVFAVLRLLFVHPGFHSQTQSGVMVHSWPNSGITSAMYTPSARGYCTTSGVKFLRRKIVIQTPRALPSSFGNFFTYQSENPNMRDQLS